MDKFTPEEKAPVKATKEAEDKPHFLNRMLKIAAYPIAVLSGVWVASREVHSSAYQKAKKLAGNPVFKDIQETFDPQYVKNAEDRVKGLVTQETYQANEVAIKARHSQAVVERMEYMGFSKRDAWFGLNNFGAKWRYINNSSKQHALIQGLTITGISIGALLTIANSKSLIDLFESKDKGDKSI